MIELEKTQKKAITIAGPVSAVLYASSSAKDTDWIMQLAKIDKNGRRTLICRGIIRARYRNSYSEPELLEPGKIYSYNLDLWHTGVTLDKKEYLALIISSAWFPAFSRNLNTGGHNETETEYVKAKQIIYHDMKNPSHILLPIIDQK